MPLHNAKCRECDWKGEAFFMPRAGIESVPCDGCGAKALEVDWSGPIREKWERQWDEESGTSALYFANRENVPKVRRRLGDAAKYLRDDGSFVTRTRSERRELDQAFARCAREDREDMERLASK